MSRVAHAQAEDIMYITDIDTSALPAQGMATDPLEELRHVRQQALQLVIVMSEDQLLWLLSM